MPNIHHVSREDVRWIDEAVGYDNVSTVGAAYSRLITLREKIEAGDILRVLAATSSELKTIKDFNDWVLARYPVFTDDPLFRFEGTPQKNENHKAQSAHAPPGHSAPRSA